MRGFKCCQKIPVKECIYSKVAGYRPATLQGCFTFQWRGGLFFRRGASFLSGGCTPWGGTSVLMGGAFEKKCRMGGAPTCPHACSEELKKCPPPSAAVQRFVNVVRERKPR